MKRYRRRMTRSGWELLPVLQAPLQWGDRWVAEEPTVRLHHAPGDHAEHPIDMAWTCRTCGEPVNGSPVRRELRYADAVQ